MDFFLHKSFSEFDQREWNNLVEISIADTPFSRYEYLSAWWATRGGNEWANPELILISARENNELVGIAPLFISEHEERNTLLLIGSIEISDYLDLIVQDRDLSRFLNGLLDFLASSLPFDWSTLDWYNLPDDSPTLDALKIESEKRGWYHLQEIYRPTPRISLNGSFEEYLANIDKKQRHEIRRKMRRLNESGRGKFYVVDQSADLDTELESFFHLMVQDPGKKEFLHNAMREQMTTAIRGAHKSGYLWLGFLEIDGEKTAASLNFDYRNKLWGYNSGVSREHMELSPGWVLMGHTIQWCCENGRSEFDFMRGDEEYKYRFGGVNRYVMRALFIR